MSCAGLHNTVTYRCKVLRNAKDADIVPKNLNETKILPYFLWFSPSLFF